MYANVMGVRNICGPYGPVRHLVKERMLLGILGYRAMTREWAQLLHSLIDALKSQEKKHSTFGNVGK